MRLVALGAATTLTGVIITLPHSKDFVTKICWNSLLLLIICISIRIIGAINANVYAKCLHMQWLEEKFKTVGFFTYWNKFVLDRQVNASSNAFLLSCIAFNIAGLLTTFLSLIDIALCDDFFCFREYFPYHQFDLDMRVKTLKFYIVSIYAFLNIIIFIANWRYINKNLVTKRLIPQLKQKLAEAKNSFEQTVRD